MQEKNDVSTKSHFRNMETCDTVGKRKTITLEFLKKRAANEQVVVFHALVRQANTDGEYKQHCLDLLDGLAKKCEEQSINCEDDLVSFLEKNRRRKLIKLDNKVQGCDVWIDKYRLVKKFSEKNKMPIEDIASYVRLNLKGIKVSHSTNIEKRQPPKKKFDDFFTVRVHDLSNCTCHNPQKPDTEEPLELSDSEKVDPIVENCLRKEIDSTIVEIDLLDETAHTIKKKHKKRTTPDEVDEINTTKEVTKKRKLNLAANINTRDLATEKKRTSDSNLGHASRDIKKQTTAGDKLWVPIYEKIKNTAVLLPFQVNIAGDMFEFSQKTNSSQTRKLEKNIMLDSIMYRQLNGAVFVFLFFFLFFFDKLGFQSTAPPED